MPDVADMKKEKKSVLWVSNMLDELKGKPIINRKEEGLYAYMSKSKADKKIDELIVACENDSKNKNKIASLMTTAMINLNILLKLINK